MFDSIRLPITISNILLAIDVDVECRLNHLRTGSAFPNVNPTAIKGNPSPSEYTVRSRAPFAGSVKVAIVSISPSVP